MGVNFRICGVILAAGASSRMGRDKALLPWPPNSTDGKTLLSAQIEAFKPFAHAIVTVAGNNYDDLAPIVLAAGELILQNPEPERGQFSSLQTALAKAVARGYDVAIITLVDSPPLSRDTLHKLRITFEQAIAEGMWGVVPEHDGRRGHPLFAGRQLMQAFLAAPPTSNARAVRHEHDKFLVSVSVPDALLSADMNTPEQYASLGSPEGMK